MRVLVLIWLFLVSISSFAGYEEDIAGLKKNMPSNVSKFIDRQAMCNHWAGEESYDEKRRQEINSATKDLKCDSLARDERHLNEKYKNKPAVLESIKNAKEYEP